MTDSIIIIDEPAVTDKRLDTEQLTVNALVVQRERMQVSGSGATEIARVLGAAPALADMGIVVRPIPFGVVSTVNSSTTALGISGVFTGTGEDVSAYAEVGVLVFASHASATNGLSLQHSSDNTNWDDTDVYTVTAATGKYISVPPEGRYFRVVYTNGGTAQTAFRLQTIYKFDRRKPSSHRISELSTMSDENDAEVVLGFVEGSVLSDSVDGGRPVKIGGQARSTNPTAVANADRVNAMFDLLGKQVVDIYSVPELFVHGNITLTTTTSTAVIAAGGASVRNYITSISGSNTSATNVRCDILDGSTVVYSFFLAANGGGFSHIMPVPFRGTANTAFNAQLSAAVTDVRVSADGYRAP